MSQFRVGDTVRRKLYSSHQMVPAGTEGIVKKIEGGGQVLVEWSNGDLQPYHPWTFDNCLELSDQDLIP